MTFQKGKNNPNYNGKLWKGKNHKKETIKKMKKPKSEEHKIKISKTLTGRPSLNKGKHHVKRKKVYCKYCNKILILREIDNRQFCNKKCEGNFRKGTTLSKETRLKISIKNKGNKRPDLSLRNKTEEYKMYGDKNPAKRPEVRKKLRIKRQKEIMIFHSGMQVGKNEKRILDELELSLKKKILRQYPICGYFIDGYVSKLNLCIEVDESHHFTNNKLNSMDIKREQEIEKELNCNFVRIKDNG